MNTRIVLIVFAIVAAGALLGCNKTEKGSTKTEPARVAHHVDENDLNTITLTERAEARLGIQLAETLMTEVQRKRAVGGEVILPPGQTIIVSAPIAGTLLAPAGGSVPARLARPPHARPGSRGPRSPRRSSGRRR